MTVDASPCCACDASKVSGSLYCSDTADTIVLALMNNRTTSRGQECRIFICSVYLLNS